MVNPTDGPLGEEPAWRGYAQPTLQGRGRSPLASTTILAVLIAGWHLPLFFLEGAGLDRGVLVPGLVTTMAVTYWYAWLFNRGGGSSLLTLVAHNIEGAVPSELWSYMVLWSALALLILIADRRRWLGRAPAAATTATPPIREGDRVMDWLNELAAWAWARHHNILSWYIRPLFLLPFCFFAYRRSLLGIALTLVALATSMAWFPAPASPSPAVIEMLDAERDYLFGPWNAAKVFASLLIPATFTALALAFWRRSLIWGLVVINGAVLFKIGWTYAVSGTAGANAHLVPALAGLVLVNALVIAAARLVARRRTEARPA